MTDINFNNKYDIADASFEILLMLAGAFIIGFLLSYFIYKKRKTNTPENNNDEKNVLKKALENCMNEKAEIKKNTTLEYSEIIENYKLKLQNTREDLENCLADKAKKKE